MSKTYCITSAIVFAFVALMHLWRAVLDLQMNIGAWAVPRSLSAVAAIGSGALALWAFRSLRSARGLGARIPVIT